MAVASVPGASAALHACVARAAQEGEALMREMTDAAQHALGRPQRAAQSPLQRQQADEALQQLRQQAAGLAAAWGPALAACFADTAPLHAEPLRRDPGAEPGFGELALMDDAEITAQLQWARLRQGVLHAAQPALSELDALVCAALAMPSVRPGSNPLRPENYLRALQQVVADTGVPTAVRQAWMPHLGEAMSHLLAPAYERAARNLREQGVVPAGHAVAGRLDTATAVEGVDIRPGEHRAPMLADGDSVPSLLHAPWALRSRAGAQPVSEQAGGEGVLSSGGFMEGPGDAKDTAAAEWSALQARLGHLTGEPGAAEAAPAAAGNASRRATEVVHRMLEALAQDARLDPAVQQALRQLKAPIRRLVRHDARFFTDEQHAARRLLNALTLRSLDFAGDGPGFPRFLRLLDDAVTYLASAEIRDAEPFERALGVLQSAWDVLDDRLRERRDGQARALMQTEGQRLQAEEAAAAFRLLPDAALVPADVLAFATGPWARVVAAAQGDAPGRGEDAGGYRAVVPLLFDCVQPDRLRAAPDRMGAAVAGLLGTVREGLQRLHDPGTQTDAVLERIVAWHHAALDALERGVPPPAGALPGSALADDEAGRPARHMHDAAGSEPVQTAPAMAPSAGTRLAGAPDAADTPVPLPLQIGQWIALRRHQQTVRTQLTWSSPQRTLFLFTAADGSTQSMTLRMLSRLAAQGQLEVIGDGSASGSGRPA